MFPGAFKFHRRFFRRGTVRLIIIAGNHAKSAYLNCVNAAVLMKAIAHNLVLTGLMLGGSLAAGE